MVEIATHEYVQNPAVKASRICVACKLVKDHQIHKQSGQVIHGTVRPTKVG